MGVSNRIAMAPIAFALLVAACGAQPAATAGPGPPTPRSKPEIACCIPTDEEMLPIELAELTIDLKIAQGFAPETVIAGDELVYTFVVTNLAYGKEAYWARLVDVLPPGVTYAGGSPGCEESVPGTVTCEIGYFEGSFNGRDSSKDLVIAVRTDESLVQDLTTPVTITNEARVENQNLDTGVVGSLYPHPVLPDPDPTNNRVVSEAQVVAPIQVDAVPGHGSRCVDLNSDDFVTVAILGTEVFDPTAAVDRSSLTLEGAATQVRVEGANDGVFEDVDRDGDLDLVVRFPIRDLRLTDVETEVVLRGAAVTGEPLAGVDTICVEPLALGYPGEGDGTGLQGSYLLVSVADYLGQPVNEGTVEVFVEHAGFPERDFRGSFDLVDFNGLIPVVPPSTSIPATLSYRVVTPDGRVSDTLVLRNDEWALAAAKNDAEFVAAHVFDLSKTWKTTHLKLITIDLLPDAGDNCLDIDFGGYFPVVILSTELFDAAEVDAITFNLQTAAARARGWGTYDPGFEDVDGDGDLDMVARFPSFEMELTAGNTVAILEGATKSGERFQATDPLCVLP